MSHMAVDSGIGFPLAPLIAVAVSRPCSGSSSRSSALRVRGVQLAVVTLAAAVAIEQFWFVNSDLGRRPQRRRPCRPPTLFGFNLGADASFRGLDGKLPSPILGFVPARVIVVALPVRRQPAPVAAARAAHARGALERARGGGRRASTSRSSKLAAFGLSSFIAGVAGVMYAYNFGSVSAIRFSALTAFSACIAFAYVGGITMVTGALIAGLYRDAAAWSTYALRSGSASPASGCCCSAAGRAVTSSS